MGICGLAWQDEVAEWLRRWTANPMGSPRVSSNLILVERFSPVLEFAMMQCNHKSFDSSDVSMIGAASCRMCQ